MPLQDVVHEQDTQILLNHAQLAMVMWQKLQRKTCPPPLNFSNTSFKSVFMKIKVEFWWISRLSHPFVFWPDHRI